MKTKELQRLATVMNNGKASQMPKGDIIAMQLVDNSMKGDRWDAALLFRLTEDVSAPIAATNAIAETPMPDKDALKRISAHLRLLVEDED